ncbi:MAG: hypothetical protein AAFP02_07980 [Bacteroidota bacterium]
MQSFSSLSWPEYLISSIVLSGALLFFCVLIVLLWDLYRLPKLLRQQRRRLQEQAVEDERLQLLHQEEMDILSQKLRSLGEDASS